MYQNDKKNIHNTLGLQGLPWKLHQVGIIINTMSYFVVFSWELCIIQNIYVTIMQPMKQSLRKMFVPMLPLVPLGTIRS